MNIDTYISTGLIENYVLGAVSEEEKAEIEHLAKEHPSIKAEIEACKNALLSYIMEFEETPPVELKNQVLDKIEDLSEEENSKTIHVKLSTKVFLAAAVVLLLISFGFNIFFYQNWQNTKQELQIARNEQLKITQDLDIQKANYEKLAQNMDMISNPKMKQVSLEGLPEFPKTAVALFWDTESKDVYLQVKNLPKPPKGKQYQLWSIDGEIVEDAGVFEMKDENTTIYKMKNVPKANAFAITLEKEGGVPVAEGAMYVLGKV